MDTLGFEPRAFRMRSGWDTTTPCALEKKRRKTPVFALLCYSRLGSSDRHWGVPIHVLATLQGVCWLAKITKRIGSGTCARCKKAKCRDPGSNRGPSDLRSDALPTELSRLDQMVTRVLVPGMTPDRAQQCNIWCWCCTKQTAKEKPPVGIEPTTIRLRSACTTN